MKYFIIIVLVFILGAVSMSASATATTVRNEVDVKASTGGNSSGSESLGKSEASVFVETTVNGQVVQHVEETKQSDMGESVKIEKHIEYIDEKENTVESTVRAEAHVETVNKKDQAITQETSSEEVAEDYQVKQEQAESRSMIVSIIEFFKSLWGRFLA